MKNAIRYESMDGLIVASRRFPVAGARLDKLEN